MSDSTAGADRDSPQPKSVPWLGVAVYFAIAVALSEPFRFQIFGWSRKMELPFGLTPVKFVLGGIGPLIAAILTPLLVRRKSARLITWTGSHPPRCLLFVLPALLIFGGFGAENPYGVERHLFGALLAAEVFLYCMLEEAGWRGYLLDVLRPLPVAAWSAIIGILWYLWHFSFLRQPLNLRGELFFVSMLLFGSWGIGMIALKTHSLFACAAIHMSVNVLFFDALMTTISLRTRWIECGICLAVWIVLIATWPHDNSLEAAAAISPGPEEAPNRGFSR